MLKGEIKTYFYQSLFPAGYRLAATNFPRSAALRILFWRSMHLNWSQKVRALASFVKVNSLVFQILRILPLLRLSNPL